MISQTFEQLKISKYKIQQKEVLKIVAYAGTGKTTTLCDFGKNNINKRMLYVAFNKSVALEASKKFSDNVEAKTSHSIAFRKIGYKYKDKLGEIRLKTINTELNLNDYKLASYIKLTLTNYVTSENNKIDLKIFPKILNGLNKDTKDEIIELTINIWDMACDIENLKINMPHDGYLKLFQLSKPILNYDVILLDEAQDTNPVVADIVFNQKNNVSIILVGDEHQAIYKFRNAVDAMGKIKGDKIFYLTKSFRFGNNIAFLANKILVLFKNIKIKVRGNGSEDRIGVIDENKQFTIITRTNGYLFDMAAEYYQIKKLGFVNDDPNFDDVLDVFYLWNNETFKIKDNYIKSFGTFMKLKNYIEDVEDLELLSKVLVVKKYTFRIPTIIENIKNNLVEMNESDIILTNAHKSKGLEFDQVRLTEDFKELTEINEGLKIRLKHKYEIKDDEINLIYVALTRAKKVLQLNNDLNRLLDFNIDNISN